MDYRRGPVLRGYTFYDAAGGRDPGEGAVAADLAQLATPGKSGGAGLCGCGVRLDADTPGCAGDRRQRTVSGIR